MAAIPSKRPAEDGAAPEQIRLKKVKVIATLEKGVANAGMIRMGQSAPANNHNLCPEAHVSPAGTKSSIAKLRVETGRNELVRHDHSSLDNLKDGYHRGGQPWQDLPPAFFEMKETRRAERHKRENELFDKVHDRVLAHSMARNKRLLKHWDDSKLDSGMIQKSNGHGKLKVSRAAANVETVLNQLPWREGIEPPLSPVFPIAPPRPTDEADPVYLDRSEIWPIGESIGLGSDRLLTYSLDLPEPCIGKLPLSHIRFGSPISPTKLSQTERHFISPLSDSGRPKTLCERFLSQRRGSAKKAEEKMSLEEMSVFVDFDARL
jgi:hypothetical protein